MAHPSLKLGTFKKKCLFKNKVSFNDNNISKLLKDKIFFLWHNKMHRRHFVMKFGLVHFYISFCSFKILYCIKCIVIATDIRNKHI